MKNHDELTEMMESIERRAEDDKLIALAEADDLAIEINVIKRRLAQETILAAVEIGKLLCRAKEKVPHGMWGEWLEENVAYSQSTANNMMRLYREYGEQEQLDFFAENRMEIFGNLSQSQAVALLGLNYEQRKAYVETHDMDKTSVRDIEADVAAMKAELDEARAERDRAQKEMLEARGQIEDAERRADEADRALFGAREEQKKADEAAMEELRDKLRSAEESRDSAVKSAQKNEKAHSKAASAWAAEKKELERRLEEAREAASQVSIDSEIDEEKRAEIEAAVAATYEDKLAELRRESERKLAAAGNPAVIEVNILFGDLQETYARIAALIEGIRAESPEMGDKLAAALRAALTTMIGG